MELKEEVNQLKKEVQEVSLAAEMLRELKKQNKRQHVIIIILIATIVAMGIGFFIYESQFEVVDKETMINAGDNGEASYFEGTGDINYGIYN